MVVVARIGYLAKGLVFVTLGSLVLLAVFGFAEGRITGTGGAVHVIGRSLPGRLGFGLLAVGLGAHVGWRLYQCLLDPDQRGSDWRGWIQRSGFLFSAWLYGSLLLVTLSAVTELAPAASDSADAAAAALAWSGGRLLLGMVGLGLIITAGYQAWRAWAQPFRDKWITSHPLGWLNPMLAWLASYGIAARAVLFLILGWSFLRAGWLASSEAAVDIATALWRVGNEAHGERLLGMLGLGLFCYGIYCLTNAALRRISVAPGGLTRTTDPER